MEREEVQSKLRVGMVEDLIEMIEFFLTGAISSSEIVSRLRALYHLSLMTADSESGPELSKMARQIKNLDSLQGEELFKILSDLSDQLAVILKRLKDSPRSG